MISCFFMHIKLCGRKYTGRLPLKNLSMFYFSLLKAKVLHYICRKPLNHLLSIVMWVKMKGMNFEEPYKFLVCSQTRPYAELFIAICCLLYIFLLLCGQFMS